MTAEDSAELRVLRWRHRNFLERQGQVLLIVVLCWLHNQTPVLWPWMIITVALQALDAAVAGQVLKRYTHGPWYVASVVTRVLSAFAFAVSAYLFLLDFTLFGIVAATFVGCANILNNTIMTRGSWRCAATMVVPSAIVLMGMPWVAMAVGASLSPGDALLGTIGALAYFGFVGRLAQILNQEGRALEEAVAAAEEASASKDRFLANMSHEIRTPLNGVVGIAQALSTTPLNALQREMVGLITSSSHVLDRLLCDALDSAKIASGSFAIEPTVFDVRAEIEGAVMLLRPRAEAKQVALDLAFDDRITGWIEADAVRVRQIVTNLVSNAVKFTDAGSVTVEAGYRLATVGEGGGERLVLSITDSGIGFDERTAARLFQPFSQADGSITRRFGGTGLGLWIARALAEAMGGTLTATSTPGKGSRFVLNMPIKRVAMQTVAPPDGELNRPRPMGEDGATGRLRVLLAEDHPTNQRVVELLLQPHDVSLTIVSNGQEALDTWRLGDFDVVLMDMQMPVMDGLTAITRIRAEEALTRRARTPIAMLTANAMENHRQAARDAGADWHIPKPVTSHGLTTGIDAAIDNAAIAHHHAEAATAAHARAALVA